MTANWTSWFGSSRSDRRTLKAFGDFVYSKKRAAAILSSGSGDFSTRASSGIETFGLRLEIASTRIRFRKGRRLHGLVEQVLFGQWAKR